MPCRRKLSMKREKSSVRRAARLAPLTDCCESMIIAIRDRPEAAFMLRFSPNRNLAHLVRWFESEDDAFATARAQDRPVVVFLGAFWCRYCQRMDEEAFSDRENMALLNAYFVALRVENAKRPDIDARYNLNGWPTIAFLAPDGKLLAASNYLPTAEFKELLLNVYMEYRAKQRRVSHRGSKHKSRPRHATIFRKPPTRRVLSERDYRIDHWDSGSRQRRLRQWSKIYPCRSKRILVVALR